MNQNLFHTHPVNNVDTSADLERLKNYYDVPEAEFPPIPAILHANESGTREAAYLWDEFARQRSRDNADEY